MEEPLKRVISIAAEGIGFACGLEGKRQRLKESLTMIQDAATRLVTDRYYVKMLNKYCTMIQAKLQDAATRSVTDRYYTTRLLEMLKDVFYFVDDVLDEFSNEIRRKFQKKRKVLHNPDEILRKDQKKVKVLHNPDEIREDAAGSGLGLTFLQHENRAQESAVDTAETTKMNGAMEMKTNTNTHSNLSQENAKSSCKTKTAEWTLLIISLLLEATSAIFDQLGYELTGMVMAFAALLLSILDLIHKAREKGITYDGRSLLPCFYRHHFQNREPFGSVVEYFGLAGAVWQCSSTTVGYYYTRQNLDNPIKMCLLPLIFALCVLISKVVKSSHHEM